jgi:molecular chaperone GrpE
MTDEERAGGVEVTPVPAEEDHGVAEVTSVEVDLSSDDEAIQTELLKLQQEVERLKELYLRKMADFDNYRKRQERDMAEFRRLANGDLLRDCLPVLDNLDRALSVSSGQDSGLRQGVELVLRQLKDILGRYGLIELDPVGSSFDPSLHEAIQRVEREGIEDATVIEAMQMGYLLGERLLRPALVVVAVPAQTPAAVEDKGAEGANGQDHRN